MGQPPISYCCFFLFQDADQYKYGKNRVEADAKRLQTKEGELLKSREALRSQLAQLRRERRDLKAAIEVNAGKGRCGLRAPVCQQACRSQGPRPGLRHTAQFGSIAVSQVRGQGGQAGGGQS